MRTTTTRTTVGTLDADRTIESGESIFVGNIVIANSSAATLIELENAVGTTVGYLYAPATTTVSIQIEHLYDQGLVVKSVGDAGVIVTVHHSAGGR